MRRPSARCYPDTVAFSTLTAGPDASSDTGARSFSAGSPLRCRVEPAKGVRVVVHGQVESAVSHTLFSPSPPDDGSSGARPDYRDAQGVAHGLCRVGDAFAWSPYPAAPALTRTLVALAPAGPSAGNPGEWAVDCEERTN
jgi:hypothetical protein